MINRVKEGLLLDEEMLGFEAVKDSIVSGNLLTHPHTLQHFRANRFKPKLVTRTARSNWQNEGSKTMSDRAIEKVDYILKNHIPTPLNEDVEKQISELINEAENKLTTGDF
jgi:trimethylamine--corrinoid protein Co-methyltransferase